MNEDEDFLAEQARLMEGEAERIRQEVVEATPDPAAQEEWIRQSNLIYGGLAAAGLVVVQPFLTESSLDLSATVCVVSFAVSIPLLAALLVLNRQEQFRRAGQGGRTSLGVRGDRRRLLAHLHDCGDRLPGRGDLRDGSTFLGIRAAGVRLEVPLEIPSPQGTRGVTTARRSVGRQAEIRTGRKYKVRTPASLGWSIRRRYAGP